jgi:hypothetical protein
VCAALVSAWLLSGWYSVRWDRSRLHSGGMYWIGVECSAGGLRIRRAADKHGMSGAFGPSGWRREPIRDAPPRWQVWFGYRHMSSLTLTSWEVFIPLWAPLVVCGLPTLMLWRRRHRIHPGFCACGYSRTGLAESVACPECGQLFVPPPIQAQPRPASK